MPSRHRPFTSRAGYGRRNRRADGRSTKSSSATTETLTFQTISEDTFREFARRHGTSPEIGRIGTYLDADGKTEAPGEPHLLGLMGCGKLCAVSCCTVMEHKTDQAHACKLDSVIVDGTLRKRGLASILVAQAFVDLVTDTHLKITIIYSYAVHPATVQMLRRLSFSKPPPMGAPISSVHIDDANRERFITRCRSCIQTVSNQLRLQCAFCTAKDRRAMPWCFPRRMNTPKT